MAGKIQDADVKSSSEVTAISRLINDTKIYVSANGINKQLSTAITDGDIGGGASGINYITNGRALTDTTGWAVYADAAASRPVDGTGGSANVTFTRSTSSPLRGAADFLFTKDAVNRQGQGASYDFTIDSADKAKVLSVSFDWAITSGTYSGGTPTTDSDVIAYVYDVTNGVLIEPVPFKLDGAVIGVNYRFVGSFQSASNSTSYRLILHTATTSASAYTLQFDSFTVSPSVVTTGAYIGDWQTYTPTVSNLGTGGLATNAGKWRRVGDSIEIQHYMVKDGSNGSGAVAVTVSLPTGLQGNEPKLANPGNLNKIGDANDAAAGQAGSVFWLLGNNAAYFYSLPNASGQFNGSAFLANKTIVSTWRMPILGWGTSQVLSSETDTRVVSAVYTGNPTGTPSTTPLIVNWPTVTKDSHGAYSAGSYTVPVSGDYDIAAATRLTGTYSVNNLVGLSLYVNGSSTLTPGFLVMPAGASSAFPTISLKAYPLKAGDIVTIRVYSDGSALSYTNSSASHFFSIARVSGPSQIASSETIAAVYRQDSGQTLTSVATIKYNIKDIDTHNAYNTATGQFTSPVSGLYELQFQLFSISATTQWTVEIRKNGVTVARQQVQPTWAANTTNNNNQSVAIGYYIFRLNAGDTMDVYLSNAVGTGSVYNSSIDNVLTIKKVGN